MTTFLLPVFGHAHPTFLTNHRTVLKHQEWEKFYLEEVWRTKLSNQGCPYKMASFGRENRFLWRSRRVAKGLHFPIDNPSHSLVVYPVILLSEHAKPFLGLCPAAC